MFERLIFGLAAAFLLTAVAVGPGSQGAPKPVQPTECPLGEDQTREDLLEAAPSCDSAMESFGACSYAASGDVALGAIVTEKCEADFLSRLSASQRRTYDQAQKRCARKYQRESGTMYRSFEAFCGAQVAQTYARRFAKGKTKVGTAKTGKAAGSETAK